MQNLGYLIDPSFRGVNRISLFAFENEAQRISYKWYNLAAVEIKSCNVVIDGQNYFDQPVRNNSITYDTIRKIATGQVDDYTTGCLLNYNHFKTYYNVIFLGSAKLKIVWKKMTRFFKPRVSIIL